MSLNNFKTSHEFPVHEGSATIVSFDRSRRVCTIAGTLGYDHYANVWDVENHKLLSTLKGHTGLITSISYGGESSDLVLTGSVDCTAKLWCLQTGECLHTYKDQHTSSVLDVDLSPSKDLVITGSSDHSACLFSLTSEVKKHTLRGHFCDVNKVKFSPYNDVVLTCSIDNILRLWDIESAKTVWEAKTFHGSTSAIVFDKTGSTFATGGTDGVIYFWDIKSSKPVAIVDEHKKEVSGLIYAPDLDSYLTCSHEKKMLVIDAKTKRVSNLLMGHHGNVTCFDYSIKEKKMVTVDDLGELIIWSLPLGYEIQRIQNKCDQVLCCSLSDHLVTISKDNLCRIWDKMFQF